MNSQMEPGTIYRGQGFFALVTRDPILIADLQKHMWQLKPSVSYKGAQLAITNAEPEAQRVSQTYELPIVADTDG